MSKEYAYPRPSTIWQFLKSFSIFTWGPTYLGAFAGIIGAITLNLTDVTTIIFSVFLWLIGLVGLFTSLLSTNYVPRVWVVSDGVQISIMWVFRKTIPWKSLIAVYTDLDSVNFVFVECEKLTWMHRFYGLIHLHRFVPGFMINRSITDFNELIGVLKKGIKTALRESSTSRAK